MVDYFRCSGKDDKDGRMVDQGLIRNLFIITLKTKVVIKVVVLILVVGNVEVFVDSKKVD